jgi:hypothetical protein
MKQTAVQFLVDYLEENFCLRKPSRLKFQEAKEMEKKQIIDFTMDFMGEDNSHESYRRESALNFFEKTFNTNEK